MEIKKSNAQILKENPNGTVYIDANLQILKLAGKDFKKVEDDNEAEDLHGLKQDDEADNGNTSITAIVSTTSDTKEDRAGDIIKVGAYDDFIKEFESSGKALPMLKQHERGNVIGEWTSFRMEKNNLIGEGYFFNNEIQTAKETVFLARKGHLNAVSVGIQAKEGDYEVVDNEDQFWGFSVIFEKVSLTEVSVVDDPANPDTEVLSIKNDEGEIDIRKLEKLLKDVGFTIKQSKTVISAAKDVLDTKTDESEEDFDLEAFKAQINKKEEISDNDVAELEKLFKK